MTSDNDLTQVVRNLEHVVIQRLDALDQRLTGLDEAIRASQSPSIEQTPTPPFGQSPATAVTQTQPPPPQRSARKAAPAMPSQQPLKQQGTASIWQAPIPTTQPKVEQPPIEPAARTVSDTTQTPPVTPPSNSSATWQPTVHYSAPEKFFSANRFALTIENIMKWPGLALVSCAAIFLVSTAISRGWIRPELQLAGAALIGFSLYLVASRIGDNRHPWIASLNHGGAVITIACAVAAHEWLGLVTPVASLGLVAAATAAAFIVSLWLRTPMPSVTAVAVGLGAGLYLNQASEIAPLIEAGWISAVAFVGLVVSFLPAARKVPAAFETKLDNPDSVEHNTLAHAFLARWQLQRLLTGIAAAFSFSATFSFNELVERPEPWVNETLQLGGIAAVVVITACLWFGPVGAKWLRIAPFLTTTSRSNFGHQVTAIEDRLMLAVPLWAWFALLPILGLSESSIQGYLGLVLAGGFGLLAALSRRAMPHDLFISHVAGVGILASVSSIAAFDGPVALVALAVQGVAAVYLSRMLDSTLLRLNGIGLAYLATLAAGAVTIVDYQDAGLQWEDAIAYFVVAAAALGATYFAREEYERDSIDILNAIAWALLVLVAAALIDPHLVATEKLLILTVASAASLVVREIFGRGVAAIGVILSASAVMATLSTFPEALLEGATVLGHIGNASVVLLLIGLAAWLWNAKHESAPVAISVAWVAVMVWLATALVHVPQGQLLLSASWALAASVAVVVGVVKADRTFQILGMATLAVVLTKLFTVDLAAIDTFWRAGLFFVLGVGFLQLGFRLPKISKQRADAT